MKFACYTVWTSVGWGCPSHQKWYFVFLRKEQLRMRPVACNERRKKCQKINACWKNNSEKSIKETSGICVHGNFTKPLCGFGRTTWGFRDFRICSCCYAHSLFVAPCFSRAAQVLKDHEEIEDNPATLWVPPYITKHIFFYRLWICNLINWTSS